MLNSVNEVDQKSLKIEPYYNGFKGKIKPIDESHKRYLIRGVYEIMGSDKIKGPLTEKPLPSSRPNWAGPANMVLDTSRTSSSGPPISLYRTALASVAGKFVCCLDNSIISCMKSKPSSPSSGVLA